MFNLGVLSRLICTALFAAACASATPVADGRDHEAPRRPLRVSLYPYIPDPTTAYWRLETAFETQHPDIDLRITLNANYYDDDPAKGGIAVEAADVWELDSVFLQDFIDAEKIAPLRQPALDAIPMIPWARDAARRPLGGYYGAPHWVCGNFLFYRTGDAALATARTFSDVERAIGANPPLESGLLIDLRGRSTLGEMYADSLMDRLGQDRLVIARLEDGVLDATTVNLIRRALALSAPGFGRDHDYHDRTGFYPRQFARRNGRAMVGYSEQLHYVLTESLQSCRKVERCLRAEDIHVGQWPLAEEGSRPIAWVDMLVVSAAASVQAREDAETFVEFVMSPEAYRDVFLVPEWGQAPRYLMPARDDLYADERILEAAPLYGELRRSIDGASPLIAASLNARLRTAGRGLDGALPDTH